MELVFTKLDGKYDALVVAQTGRERQRIACPKQGIIPHDMVHFAVESVLAHRGFLSLLGLGQAAGFSMQCGPAHECIERLVEVFQAELWGERLTEGEFVRTYNHACPARSHASLPISNDEIALIHAKLEDLGQRWNALPVNGSLVLHLELPGTSNGDQAG